ncbi:MAG: alpha/beta hydrolase [Acidobacteriota bacterium]
MRNGSVNANGLEFHYLEMGDGPLVLMLHGFPDHARTFRHQMPALAEAGYRVVAPYMRGYGATKAPDGGPFSVPKLGEDIVALIDALGAETAVVVGHDWGAAASYAAAGLAPEKISKLVTMAVPYGPGLAGAFVTDPEQQRRSWYMFFFQTPIAELAVAHDDFAFIDRLWTDWSPGFVLEESEMRLLKETLAADGTLSAALGYYRHALMPTPEIVEQVAPLAERAQGPIAVPTLYLHGARDGCIGAELAEGMEALFTAGLTTHVLESAGHFLHQEEPETVTRALLAFLGPAGG